MSDEERDKLLGFLVELRDLCGRYGYEIGGCGCCGSPWLNTSKDGPTNTVTSTPTGRGICLDRWRG